MRLRSLLLILLISNIVYSGYGQTDKREMVGIFVDTSASMRTQLEREIILAKELVKQIDHEAVFSLYGFTTEPDPRSTCTRFTVLAECLNKDSITNQIENLYIAQGQTTLWDAINSSSENLNAKRSNGCGEPSNRVLVVITDGEDRASTIKPADVISNLKMYGTRVYIVGLLDALPSAGNSLQNELRRKSRQFLEELSSETGGKTVFPDKKKSAEEIIKELLVTVAVTKK